jgi:hypothetical protein
MLVNYREGRQVNLMRHVVDALDVFSGAVFITTFAAEIVVFIVDEIKYYHDSKELSEGLFNHLFITILIVVLIWLFILSLPLILQVFNRKKSFRDRIPSILFIVLSLLFILLSFLKIFPLQTILIVSLILTLVILFGLRKHSIVVLKSSTSRLIIAIYLSHLSLVLIPVFSLAGILAFFTKAIQPFWFWIASAFCFCICVACILSLSKWREELLELFIRCVHPLIVAVNFTKGRLITIKNFLISLFITIFHFVRTSLAVVKNCFITLTLRLRRSAHEIQTELRRKR